MNVARSLALSAFYFPDRVALTFKDRRWAYRELDMETSPRSRTDSLNNTKRSYRRFKTNWTAFSTPVWRG